MEKDKNKKDIPEFRDGDFVMYKGTICKIVDGKIESNLTALEKMENLEKRLSRKFPIQKPRNLL